MDVIATSIIHIIAVTLQKIVQTPKMDAALILLMSLALVKFIVTPQRQFAVTAQ